MSAERIVRKLDDLLARQASCLKEGDIAGAFAVAPAIEKLVDRLESAEPEPSVARLQEPASRNAGLIEAARRGVETARAVLGEAERPKGFTAYDAQGRATHIGS